jgi:hypothetical protein
MKYCQEKDCKKQATYNYKNIKKGAYCKPHAKPDMLNVMSRICVEKDCIVRASFNYIGKPGLYCKKHKKDNMQNVNNTQCQITGCIYKPIFRFINKKKAIYCKLHRIDNMIEVDNNKSNINTEPVLNNNIYRCLYCNNIASFNYPSQKKRLYCSLHKLDKMIDIVRRKCIFTGCDKAASYGDNDIRLYCGDHKLSNMINLNSKYCIINGCGKKANHNYKENKTPIYCKEHRLISMVCVTTNKKKCKELDCVISPSFNYLGLSAEYCYRHKKPRMLKVTRIRCLKCKNNAEYGIDTVLRHCDSHKELNEINLVNLVCKLCKLPGVINSTLVCQYCNDWQNDYKRLNKQLSIKKLLDDNKIAYYKYDKVIDEISCGRERPDFLLFIKGDDNITRAIIIEVDEHQHRHITEECETIRMINITNALQLQTLFIRYNPDNYKTNLPILDEKGRHQKLLWVLNHKKLINFKSKLAAIYICYDGDKYISTKI